MKKLLNIKNKSPFVSVVFGIICSDIQGIIDDKDVTVRFGIFGGQMAIKGWNLSSPELTEARDDALAGGIVDTFQFDGVYYFEFTGSHFQQLEEKPAWNADPNIAIIK